MNAWLAHHLHSLKIAWQRLLSTPLATLFTALVIGVAACLPAGLYALLDNFDRLAGGFTPRAEITVFLTTASSEAQARALAGAIRKEDGVAGVRMVAKGEGLKQLQAAGLADIVAGLSENPLPHVLMVATQGAGSNLMEGLAARIRAHAGVEQVQMDADWLKRLAALLDLGRNLIATLSLVLGLAVVAVTANTIRLQIYAQRDEIEVARLIGATERFIRRPFLYFGGLQGLAGGAAAWLLTLAGLWLLRDSVAGVAAAYGLQFALSGLSLAEAGVLVASATLLGWLGAFFAVWQTLRHIDRNGA
jgi:cell division transport system permease protein